MASSPPIIEILQFFTIKPRIPTDSSKFSTFIRQCSIPFLDRNILKDISEKLNSKMSVIEALSDISSTFIFSSSDLEAIRQFSNLSEYNNRILLTICFSNCISFLFQDFSETYIEDLTNVLTTLSFFNNAINKRLTSFLYLTILNHSVTLIDDTFPSDLITLICQHISLNYSDLPDSLSTMAKVLEKAPNDDNEAQEQIYTSIRTLLTTFIKESIDFDDTTLSNVIKEKVKILDQDTLTLLPLLSKNRPSKNVSKLYSLLPKAISLQPSDFDTNSTLFCQPIDFEFSEWKNEYETTTAINSDSNDEIIDDLNDQYKIPEIDREKTTGAYLPKELRKQVKSIVSILDDVHYRHINSFFNAYADLMKENYDLKDYLCFQYFMTHVKFYHDIEEPAFDALMCDSLFVPSVTLFNCTEGFEITSFYREKAIMIFIFHGQKFLSKLFDRLRNYPFLFAEAVIRVMNHLPNVIPSSLCSQSTLQSLLTVQHRLGCISFNMSIETRHMAVQARSAVFTLIFDIFMNPLPSDLVLNNFLPSLSEKSFSQSLFARLDKEQRISNCIFLKNAFDILSYSNIDDELVTVLMNYVTNSIINEPETTSTVLLSLFNFLEINQNEKILSMTLDLINSMLSKTHHCFFVNGVFSKMSEIIPKVYVTSQKWKDQLFSMLRMNTNVEVGSLFLITNPLILTTVFSVFMNFEEYELLSSEMLRLCDYSSYNRISLYEGEIDLLLLEMILNFPKDFDFRRSFIKNIKKEDELFDFTIPLFLRTASTRSSEVVAERMLKIISPREDGQFSPIASKFLDRVSPLRSKIIPISTVAYPIGISPPFLEINDIPFSEYLKNGTIIFWLYVDSFLSMKLQVKSTIFKIDLPKFTFLELYLLNDSLQCVSQQNHKNKPRTDTLIKNVPTNSWFFVVVNFKVNYKTVEMTTQVNLSNEISALMIPVKSSKSLYAKFVVGTSTRFHGNRGLLSCIYQLYGFYYYDYRLATTELNDIYQNRIENACFKYNPVFGFPVVSGYQTKKQIHANTDNRGPSNLINVLSYQYPNERFLPIFDSFDKCTPEYSIQLIGSLKGLFGPAVVKTFRTLPCFFITTKQPLLYLHYLEFFSLLSECQTEKDQFSLIDNILLNFEIWIKAEKSELQQIVQHICSDLFEACTSYFLSDTFFKKIFGIVRIYFSPEQLKLKADQNVFIPFFDNLMLNRAKLSLTSNDVDIYLSTLLMSNDKKLVEHLLLFYPQLISFNTPNIHHFVLLLKFDFQSNYELFHLFCKCIYKTSREFYNAAIILSYLMEKPFWYDGFLDDIKRFPELFVLGIFGALRSQKSIQNDLADLLLNFANDVKRRNRILSCPFWMIWPIIFALETTEEVQRKISVFIAKMILNNSSSPIQALLQLPVFQDDDKPTSVFNFSSSLKIDNESLNTVFTILKVFQSLTTLDAFSVQNHIMTQIYEEKGQSMSSKDLDLFLKILFFNRFINFNLNPISNRVLNTFYRSPFSEENFNPIPKKKTVYSMHDLFEALHLSDNLDFIFNVNILPTTSEIKHYSHLLSKRVNKSNSYLKLFKYLYEYECLKGKKKLDMSLFDSHLYESFYPDESDEELDTRLNNSVFRAHISAPNFDQEDLEETSNNTTNETETETETENNSNIKLESMSKRRSTFSSKYKEKNKKDHSESRNEDESDDEDDDITNENIDSEISESKNFEKQKKIFSVFKKINRLINNTIIPLLKLSRDVTRYKTSQMIQFFNQFKKPVSEVKTTVIEDPLTSFQAELIENSKEMMKMKSKFIHDFTPLGPEIYVQPNKYLWKRMFTFSSDFNSILLKKVIKNSDERSYDRHKYDDRNSIQKEMNQFLSSINHTKIIAQFECHKITISSSKEATLFICKNMLIITVKEGSHIIIKTSSLRYILTRNRLQKPTAIEFFTTEGLSYLLDFAPNSASQVLRVFQHIRMKNLIEREDSDYSKFISQNGLVEKWAKGEMTNFDFLLRLNMHTGRSFQDPQNGVIFPWVILPDGKKRDLSEPITMQNSNRLQHFSQLLEMNGYMFGTSPSNAMLLAYYFVRIEPYTSLHLKIHDGHFDAIERMFRSMPTFFKTLLNGDEWKEATPEFFCFPEMFLDLNRKKSTKRGYEVAEPFAKGENNGNSSSDDFSVTSETKTEVIDTEASSSKEMENSSDESKHSLHGTDSFYSNLNRKDANTTTKTVITVDSVSDFVSDDSGYSNRKSDNKKSSDDNSDHNSINSDVIYDDKTSSSSGVEINLDTSSNSSSDNSDNKEEEVSRNSYIMISRETNLDDIQYPNKRRKTSGTTNIKPKDVKNNDKESKVNNDSEDSKTNSDTDESTSNTKPIQSSTLNNKEKNDTQDKLTNSDTEEPSNESDDATKSDTTQTNDNDENNNNNTNNNNDNDNNNKNNNNDNSNNNNNNDNDNNNNNNSNTNDNNNNNNNDGNNNNNNNINNDNDNNNNNNSGNNNDNKGENLDDNENAIHIYKKDDDFQIGELDTDYSSIVDYVYLNRKMLESEYVSLHLGEWVSLLWGTGQNNLFMPYLYTSAWDNDEIPKEAIPTMVENLGSVPPQVFDTKLPKRILNRRRCQFDKLISVKIPKVKASRNGFIFEKNGIVRVIICFFDGTIQRYSVNFGTKEAEPVYLSPLKLKIPSDAKYAVERETVFVFDEKSERIHCVNFEQLKTVNSKIGSIDFALGGTNFGELITATKSGSVKFWRFPDFVPNSLFSISIESISAVAVNQSYGIFICTTNDGFLRTYSVEQKIPLNSVKLNSNSIVIIEKIISTESFGFIVLFTPGFLYLFTINSFLIKKVAIDFEIYQWTTFKDQSGFDFICCTDPIGNIFVFEAYYPNHMEQIAACHERIISVQYLPSVCAIIAHASSSTVYFIPYR